jgi:hypothetical protein
MSQTTCSKIGYPDAATAHAAAQVIRSRRHRGKRGKQTRAYHCQFCSSWHLTSERERPA